MDKLRYPVGRFLFEGMTSKQKEQWISEMELLPSQLNAALQHLDDVQLDTPYRSGGWTPRQLVHHIADAAMNSFVRFKLTLTEVNPTIKPFREEHWANTADSLQAPPELSLGIVENVYIRWVMLLRSMSPNDFNRMFYHPELGRQIKLDHFLGYAAWHGRHHTAQIISLKERKGW